MPKKRLLLIEDDMDVAEMLQAYFSGRGYEVINAPTGTDGVAMARAKSPNLILLDIMLPDMDGFDVCRALRSSTLTRHIPITFLTQRDRRADKVAGLELGADDYITKPFDVDELRLRVASQLQRASRTAIQDPHTGLPTQEVIDEVHAHLQLRNGWTHLDIRLQHLSAFRSVYGFMSAEDALHFAAQSLRETVVERGTPDDFVGTRGEGHFTAFTFSGDIPAFREALQARFAGGVAKFYNYFDLERGHILLDEGAAGTRPVPIMALAVEVIHDRPSLA